MSFPTPRSKAAYLLQYITDESCIIAHIKRDFGYEMSLAELRRIKSSLPQERTYGRKALTPIFTKDPSDNKPRQDLLLGALATYFEKRRPHEAEHWNKVRQKALGIRYGAAR